MSAANEESFGLDPLPNDLTHARIWAPRCASLHLRLPHHRLPLRRTPDGVHTTTTPHAPPGTRYTLELPDGRTLPDPHSRHQPLGPTGPSEVVALPWRRPRPVDLERAVLYELHLGTATPEGTCDAWIPHLPNLVDLGVTALQLMPVHQAPGDRTWGYDPVLPDAVHHAYGGPHALLRLIDAAHDLGLAVFLDVVLTHLGPQHSPLPAFAPYLDPKRRTPWGAALRTRDPRVRAVLLAQLRQWIRRFGVDGVRLDAVDALPDPDFWRAAIHTVRALGAQTIVESRRLHGADARWVEGAVLRSPRTPAPPPTPGRVVFLQSHDSAGRHPEGRRPTRTLAPARRRLAALWLLLTPGIPQLFMGEEWDADAPFPYFADVDDPRLRRAIRRGRARALRRFRRAGWDPCDPATAARAVLHPPPAQRRGGLYAWYRRLIALRAQALGHDLHEAWDGPLWTARWGPLVLIANPHRRRHPVDLPPGPWSVHASDLTPTGELSAYGVWIAQRGVPQCGQATHDACNAPPHSPHTSSPGSTSSGTTSAGSGTTGATSPGATSSGANSASTSRTSRSNVSSTTG